MTDQLATTEPRCCFIEPHTGAGCYLPAQWRITYGNTADDYTESCEQHAGALLTDAPEHRVYPLAGLNTLRP